jgi:predicted lipoprotein with Yx(FWY)xxD motif
MKKQLISISAVAVLVFASTAFAADSKLAPGGTPYATPPGITLIDVTKLVDASANQYLWRRIGDAVGKPVYTFDQDEAGRPTCVGECAKDFVPFPAPKGAVAYSDWSIINRDDGVRQWAYQGKPLYYYTGTDPEGEPETINISSIGAEDPRFMDPGSDVFSPKPGWKRAAYTPELSTAAPAEVELASLATANGYGFVDAISKKPTYVLKNPPRDPTKWAPIYAPSLGVTVGNFTIIEREDGTKQWAYKGVPLYSFNGDYSTSDMNGPMAEKGAQVALAFRHFMPDSIGIRVFETRGPLMVNKDGFSVYTQSRQQLQYGGRETRDGYRYNYSGGKAVGTKGCVGECTRTWKPVLAPKNAQASGFWEVETRDDGTRQWSYKGSPLYTYVGDKRPSDIEGNNLHEIIYGDPEGKIDLSVTGGDVIGGNYTYGSGFYWHTAGLFN